MTRTRSTRAVVNAALAVAVAVGLTFGTVACSSSTDDQAAATPTVLTVDAPLNADPSDNGDPTDQPAAVGTDPAAPSELPEPTTGPAYAGDTAPPSETDTPSAPTVSTAGPIAPAGNIEEIVPEVPVTTAPPVALTDTADFGGKVTAKIAEVAPIQATATLPGEVSGPAIAVTVEVNNGSADTIGLDSVTVTLTDSAGNVASNVTGSTGALSGALGAAGTAKGMYVFSVPADARNPVTVTVTYSSGAPTLVFTGAVAGG
jgi:hypothetical protein